jgi:hypothetical protein
MEIVSAVAGNLAFVLNAGSLWMKDIVWLRIVALMASTCFVVYSATVDGGPLYLMIIWSFVFMAINLFRLAQPVLVRWRVQQDRAPATTE